ncbi:indole-3-glycerol phosphate synthase-domain-containing protein [Vararia minispora EC-137]|uniref:Indole-3-glycerol phosphate synthase-domain-containing protein n=1 Tax=Vararia minispora EC-137 TaxID=1314806 RepID=A0ACB8QDW7_9AGAM|nr:indole-3-glycerol phosphate synthase-domain-containing protein [Vararia minispora EC-137]
MALPTHLARPLDILMIDNFDSFTWNLYQSLTLLGADVTVIRNDTITAEHLPRLQIRALIISPGPGHPVTDSGISREAVKYFVGKVPVMGVCMGLECLVDVFGGEISYAGEIMHGKLSSIRHDGRGCLKGIPQGFKSTRYHSLSANVKTLPDELAITAVTEQSGVIMGVRHRRYTLEAVQYHPESILSEAGDDLFRNFLSLNGGTWEENPFLNVLDPELPPFPIGVPNEKAHTIVSKVPSVLDKIYAQRLRDVEAAKANPSTSPTSLTSLLSMHLAPPLISVVDRLKSKTPALMAEIKRASPSKGAIAPNANSAQQALAYALAGASVVSVLTEPTWFKGSLLDMRLARDVVDTLPNRPAILRKDFILDEYQIAEARLHGADTVLLIVAMLPLVRLKVLYEYSLSLGMEPLVEVNSVREMEAALDLGAKIIGVNNRNLHNFEVDMETTTRLVETVKGRDVILCALSGIQSRADVVKYVEQGVNAILVGEALMRAPDPRTFVAELCGWSTDSACEPSHMPPLVKICGIRSEDEAVAVATAGVDMIGLMLTPHSKRHVPLETAQRISAVLHYRRSSQPATSKSEIDAEPVNEPWFTRHARRLSRSPARPLVVGVFQNQPLSFILHAVAVAQLDIVQLHGSEPLEWSKQIPVPVIRVFHVDGEGGGLEGITRPNLHEFVLLDAAVAAGGLSGGTGSRVDWELAKAVVEGGQTVAGGAARPFPIILAGGLTPDNVAEAVLSVGPWAVDVSSGVEDEARTGKDLELVKRFVVAAKGLE